MDVDAIRGKRDRMKFNIETMLMEFYQETGILPNVEVYWYNFETIGGNPGHQEPKVTIKLTL